MSSPTAQIYTDLTSDDINAIRAIYATPTAPAPAPSISSFSPAEGYPPYDYLGQPGTTVTINGSNLDNPTQATFNGLIATIASASSNASRWLFLKEPPQEESPLTTLVAEQPRRPTSELNSPTTTHFSGKQKIKGTSGFSIGNTSAATEESGEPVHAGVPGAHSVWFNWKVPDGVTYVNFKTKANAGSGFNTTLAAYQSSAVNALTPLASNDDCNGTMYSSITFQVSAGQGIKVAVDGNGGSAGDVNLKWNTGTSPTAANGEIADGYVPPPYHPDPPTPPGTLEP